MAGNNPTSQVNYFYLASGASFSNQMDVRESVVHMSNVAAEPGRFVNLEMHSAPQNV